MELDYYIEQSGISDSLVSRKLLESGGPYDYSNTTSSSNNYDLMVDEDFTLFLCFDVFKHTGYVGQQIISNYNISNGNGIVFGILASGQLFLRCTKSKFSVMFTDITIGERNTICLQKSGNSFSVIQYDNFSKAIHKIQSFVIPSAYIDSGINYFLCGTSYPSSGISVYAFGNISLLQLLCLNEAVSQNIIIQLFSGFLPYTISESTITSNNLIDQSAKRSSVTPDSVYNYIQSFDSLLNSGIISFLDSGYSGEYRLSLSKTLVSGVSTNFSGDYYNFENFCENLVISEEYFSLTTTPTINSEIYLDVYINKQNQKINISSIYSFDNKDYAISIDKLWSEEVVDTGVSVTEDTGFYSTFSRNGVLIIKDPNSLSDGTLKIIPSGEPEFIGLNGIYDTMNNGFYIEDENSTFFLNGDLLSSYSIDSNILTVLSGDSSTGELIYDIFTGVYVSYGDFTSLTNASINEFSSIVFIDGKRAKRSDWIETSDILPFTSAYYPRPENKWAFGSDQTQWILPPL